MFNIETLRSKSDTELTKISKDLGVKLAKSSTENDKIFAILDFQASNPKLAKDYFSVTETPTDQEESPKAIAPKTKRTPAKAKPQNVAAPVENISAEAPEISVEETPADANNKAPKRRKRVANNQEKEPETTPVNVIAETVTPVESPAEVAVVENRENRPQNNNRQNHPNQNQRTKGNYQNGQQNSSSQNRENHPNNKPQQHPQETAEPAEQKKEYSFDGIVTIEGVLEILPDNYGFLRSSDFSYISSPDDVYVSTAQIRNYGLKTGDTVKGIVRLPKEGEKYFSLQKPTEVNGRDLDFIKDRVAFEYLTPLFPQEKFNLAEKGSTISTRIVDLFAPIGKGQRAMIVAQPKTGKTMLLKDIANAISSNHPEAYMMVLLIDERPEEVTDMERSVNAEVIASTFDESAEKHVKVANLVLAKAQRMVECGHDVVILLDSITRLARAYNTVTPASGKILSGGVDANALHRPKRFFGAARKIEGGGSLTIIATALIDTGSKMDEVIFEEFKGTGNMELQLDRKIANKRVYPAIDLVASSTRRDDLLHDEVTQQRMWILRKYLADMNPVEAMEFVEKNIKNSLNNEDFLMSMNR